MYTTENLDTYSNVVHTFNGHFPLHTICILSYGKLVDASVYSWYAAITHAIFTTTVNLWWSVDYLIVMLQAVQMIDPLPLSRLHLPNGWHS